MSAQTVQKNITFIQYDIPPLKAGEYTVTAAQTVNQIEPNSFSASKRFAVPGNRFTLNGDDIVSVFPAALANDEFTGVMPLVVLKRETLPWQRTSVFSEDDAPWLALLLFEEGEAPTVQPATAADVITLGTPITVAGSSTPVGTGALPARVVSYPKINPLDYGQSPTDPCSVIDLDVDLFSKVCPSAADLPYLAHIRKTDTYDSLDTDETEQQWAIVLGNRWPTAGANAYAFLVSLENMGDLLPGDDGTPSSQLPAGGNVRLIVFRTWRFFANDLDETFQSLCENLNKVDGVQGLSTLRLPAATPDPTAVAAAIAHQATGSLSDTDASVLVQNALCLGYTALDHHLREAGDTVSWYRGPLAPYAVAAGAYTIAPCPDAVLRYDPQTGLFDASYAQAWQLGQLLALQNTSFSVSLYNWKQSLQKGEAAQAEMAIIDEMLGGSGVFQHFLARRANKLALTPLVPPDIADWIGRLQLLKGVPFSALVPDEGMLPVESLRFFQVDQDWVAALIDGAFSIGRAGTTGAARDAAPLARASKASLASARRMRRNNAPHIQARLMAAADDAFTATSGVLLRSQLVSGWPRLQINGYSDTGLTTELPKLRMERLSADVLICLFEGAVQSLAIHEAPEQLHCGVEGNATAGFTTTLREVNGDTPGQQYMTDPKGGPPTAAVAVRSDGQTVRAADTATAIQAKLNNDFAQNIKDFTSAEFALEMIKGVVKVEYKLQ